MLLLVSTTTIPLLLHGAIHITTDTTVLPLYTVVQSSGTIHTTTTTITTTITTTTTTTTITTTTTTATTISTITTVTKTNYYYYYHYYCRGRTYDLEGGNVRAAEVHGRRDLLFRAQ